MIRFSRSPIRPIVFILGIAFGILFAMEPFAFFPAGGLAAFCGFLLFQELRKWNIKSALYWLVALSQTVNLVVFFWIPSSISAISGAGWAVSWTLFLAYGLFSHAKFYASYLGWYISLNVYSKYGKSEEETSALGWLLFPIWSVLGDLVVPQLFPWFWGNMAEGNLSFSQISSYVGIYGTGFFLLVGGSSLALILEKRISRTGRIGILVFGIAWTLGGFRLYLAPSFSVPAETPKLEENVLKLSASLIQPNSSPGKRELAENPEFMGQTISTNLELGLRSSLETSPPPDILFFPESAVPFHGTDPTDASVSGSSYSPTFHGTVLYLAYKTGADILYNELNQSPDGLKNQVTLISSNTGESTRYEKRRLLAFGEYLPFESIFPSLRSLFRETSRYVTGGTPKPLTGERYLKRKRFPSPPTEEEISLIQDPENFSKSFIDGGSDDKVVYQALPLICYEAMFPGLVRESIENASNDTFTFLTNPTNDAWFASRVEAWQHGGAVRFRAIEFGLTFVRPAVSGISFAVDSYGRILNTPTNYGEKATESFLLPATKLNKKGNTFFSRWGNIPFFLYSALITALFPFFASRFVRETRK
ncbi:apolipoprotein N-acyltransferase [Leptospira wolffii]|uniref:apolipoprotein N-acyltransferase n=1 Tax=Leptospira wolffii TaxID=409998 RepID=UPI001082B88C|nr:apolipoprotein N-acyltransferase [Leptospira wolffii]TGK58271.1 apolipoprotein N-acyltransferase [Leptospira wolffii]TGK66352.1 apolipoprotein N-acyltransferase [Leptospira wolffii]TGK68949.1 apolipoprotein N-acyltransferase [Leptospira wolffii]TGL27301.1 apolipoprotein N-acyltransferase [Leptospira wolffii]